MTDYFRVLQLLMFYVKSVKVVKVELAVKATVMALRAPRFAYQALIHQ